MTDDAIGSAHPDMQTEQRYIDYARDCLEQAITKLRAKPPADSAGDKASARALKEWGDSAVGALEAAKEDVCFGRIDPEAMQPLYVGRRAIADGTRQVVISWQAPKAQPFYEATQTEPHGLIRRRRFTLDGPVLVGISEDVFREGVPEFDVPDDALLLDLERSRSPEMRDIVATIQRDQFNLISHDMDGVLIVQGGPGTGKTAVGLHRASFLLYRNREVLGRAGVLVVGPNRTFMEYIGRVLPGLGEESVDQVTVSRLTSSIRPSSTDSQEVARLKGDIRLAAVIEREASRRIGGEVSDFTIRIGARAVTMSGPDIAAVAKRVRDLDLAYMEGRTRFRAELVATLVELGAGGTATGAALEELSRSLRTHSEFHNLAERVWPTLTGRQLVHELLTGPRRLRLASEGILSADEREILRRPETPLEKARWTYSDVALVHEADVIVRGAGDRYGHVILDEAQDLTPMEVRMVGRHAPSGSMTLLGDLAQATGPWIWGSWEELAAHLATDKTVEVADLLIGYRVPAEVMALAERALGHLEVDVAPPTCVRRLGEEPALSRVPAVDRAAEVVRRALMLSGSDGTVGVIAPQGLHPQIEARSAEVRLEVFDVTAGGLGQSVSLLEPHEAKGLEFDHVVVVEPALIAALPQGGALLYVALSRATTTLDIVFSENLPSFLDDSPEPPPGHSFATPAPEPIAAGLSLVHALALATAPGPGALTGAELADALERAATVLRVDGEPAAAAELARSVADAGAKAP